MSETTPLSVFEPAGDAKGGVVVIQEIFGVNDHIEDVCRRLADEGWLAVAPHLFHRSGDPKLGYDAMEEGRSHAQELTADGVMEDVDAAVARIAEAGIPPVAHRHRRVLHGRQRRARHRGTSGPRRGGDVLRRRGDGGTVRLRGPRRRGAGTEGAVARAVRRPRHRRFRSPASRSCASPPPSPASRPRSSAIPTPATASTATSGRATTSRRRPTPGAGWASGSTTTSAERSRSISVGVRPGSPDLHPRFRFVSYGRTRGRDIDRRRNS